MSIVGEGWDLPQGSDAWNDFTWWKISGSRVLNLVILVDSPVWYAGHFYKGRMRPCQGENCKMCADGVGKQLRYVICGMEISAGTVGLLELGRSVALELRDLGIRYERLRGLVVEFGKVSYSKQSRMTVTAHPGHEVIGWASAAVPDIKTALRNTWLKAGEQIPDGFEETKKPNSLKAALQRPKDDRGRQEPEESTSGVKTGSGIQRPDFRAPRAVR